MANKGILSKNYYIVPEAVADFGTQVYNMMAEADQAMAEASEIIADIASLTERVPSHIRCNELLEACASAQAEIKNVDFLSYGQKVEQGLQNLLDHNQYITEHFIKKMGTHTEKMRGLGEEFKRLTDTITYSGEGVQSKGIAFSAVSNVEGENTDGEDENASVHGTEDLPCWGAAEVLEVSTEEVMAQVRYINNLNFGENTLRNYMNARGIADKDEIDKFITWLVKEQPGLLVELYVVDSKSSGDVWHVYDKIFNKIVTLNKVDFNDIYNKYNLMITVEDVENLRFTEDDGSVSSLNDVQKETFVKCWNMLVGMGLSLEQIIGVMANIYDEGRLSPTNAQDGKEISTGNGVITLKNGIIDDSHIYTYSCDDDVGYGICQWTYQPRKEGLLQMAEDMNGDVSDLDVQLAYLKYEMENFSKTDTKIEGYSLDDFLKVVTVENAVNEFMIHFENPYLDGTKRLVFANDIQEWYNNI